MPETLTSGLLPVGALHAARLGLVDEVFPSNLADFRASVEAYAAQQLQPETLARLLDSKQKQRQADEAQKQLQQYRDEELANMRVNFWGSDPAYHEARRRFVFKAPPCRTPRHLALHRSP